jgi:hypothetical protein
MPETLPVMTLSPGPTDSAQVRTQLVTSLELEMSGPIPAGDYVEHFDPGLPHHRAWLLAVLEQLVAHEPQALEEGGTLRRLLTAHQAGVAPSPAPSLPVPAPPPKPPSRAKPLPVPWFAQLGLYH